MRLDLEDFALLRELLAWGTENYPRGPLRVSLPYLAKVTGLHPNTVRLRLKAMRENGVIEGIDMEPRPSALGVYRCGWLFRDARTLLPEEIERCLEPFPSVSTCVIGRNIVFAHVWYTTPAERDALAPRIAAALGAGRYEVGYDTFGFPEPPSREHPPTPLDWRILLALRRSQTRSLAAIARSLRISPRTAERRAQRLVRAGFAAMLPRLHFGNVEGWLLVSYQVPDNRPETLNSLLRAFPERILGPMCFGGHAHIDLPMANLLEVERRRREALKLPGIPAIEYALFSEIVFPERFEKWLAEHVESAQSDARNLVIRSEPLPAH